MEKKRTVSKKPRLKLAAARGEEKREAISRAPSIKIVQVFSPIVVRTDAASFQALVQQLTGRDSNICSATYKEREEEQEAPPLVWQRSPDMAAAAAAEAEAEAVVLDDIIWDDSSLDVHLDPISYLDDLAFSNPSSPTSSSYS